MSNEAGITQDEAAIYDRQIRLWGLDAQQRIQKAHILVAGVRALTDETCKNLALAGIGSLTLLDHTTVIPEDLGAHFFFKENDIGKNRAVAAVPAIEALNPHVVVKVDEGNIADKDDAFFAEFDVVLLIHEKADILTRVNAIRKAQGKPFYAADAFGWFGYIFCDLNVHTYIEEKKSLPAGAKAGQDPVVTKTTCVEQYVTLNESLQKDWSSMSVKALKKRISPLAFVMQMILRFEQKHHHLPTQQELLDTKTQYLQELGISDSTVVSDDLISMALDLRETELCPVASIVGGVLAQEIIKVLSAKELPISNWFFYNALDGTGLIHRL
ncbi:uncharacterized protein BYT42DRAFT_574620 [Radiomyces spectabilis]|uniref:uncharacterized protein n=1 Tax=Radiomyces spectabilis TaxID=64574 RepID=UPI002220F07C|nr:uncharacterized protein BYT42DRAFT_574620 [Radiomyces spectabilis]KAI8376441.1 hypothetical protein BYT42DRAFT_574620 [Radiomyces spectabilis]